MTMTEPTQWLGMMSPRLEVLRDLLAEDGSSWAIMDDDAKGIL